MLIFFLLHQRHRDKKMISRGSNLSETYYLQVLAILWGWICKKWPELCGSCTRTMHLSHNVLTVKCYLATRGIPVLAHAAYDFFWRSSLKRNPVWSVEEAKQKLVELLNSLTKEWLPAGIEGEHWIVGWSLKLKL